MATLKGLARGDRLEYPAYYRAVLERGMLAFGDHDFRVGLERWRAGFATIDMVQYVNQPAAIPGDSVAVVDIATDPRGAANTVGDLIGTLDGITHLIRVRQLERVTKAQAYDKGPASRDSTQETQEKQKADESPITQAASAVKWLVLAIVLVALVVLVSQGRAIARHVTT